MPSKTGSIRTTSSPETPVPKRHTTRDWAIAASTARLDSLDELVLVMGFDKELVDDRGFGISDGCADRWQDKRQHGSFGGSPSGARHSDGCSCAAAYRSRHRGFGPLSSQHELKNVSDINAVKISQGDLSKITPLIKVNSSYFTVSSKYTLGKVTKNVEALLKRSGSTVSIISWRES